MSIGSHMCCDRFAKFEYAESRITFESKNVCSSHKAIVWLENTWNRTHKLYGQLLCFFLHLLCEGEKSSLKKKWKFNFHYIKNIQNCVCDENLTSQPWWTVSLGLKVSDGSLAPVVWWDGKCLLLLESQQKYYIIWDYCLLHHVYCIFTFWILTLIHIWIIHINAYMHFLVIFWLKWYSDIMENV